MTAPEDQMGPDRDTEAALWCLALAEEDFDAARDAALDQWLADDGNAAALRRQLALWDHNDALAALPQMLQLRSQALEDFRSRNERRWAPAKRWRLSRPWQALAASLLLIAGSTAIFLLQGSDVEYFSTALGERKTIGLEDGTTLTLDADSAVEERFSQDRRNLVVVRGRAKFDVAKDSLRPFAVTAGTETVVATGTSFSVEKLGTTVDVVLYEGKVTIVRAARNEHFETLQPGQSLALPSSGPLHVAAIEPARASAWTMGQLDFSGEPIAGAVARVNRYAEKPVVLDPSVPGALRVTGVFDAGDTSAFAEGVAAVNGMTVRVESDRLVLTAA
ncbi:FecR family protein [Blastomonas sp.]|jgi:transmembrane sensor|uniref:FecR family protein n=1 Tax=Blastomonas sp. TaxID=1909299 RepID=UPI00391CB3DE